MIKVDGTCLLRGMDNAGGGRWYVPATGDGQRCVSGTWYVHIRGMDNAVLVVVWYVHYMTGMDNAVLVVDGTCLLRGWTTLC